MHRSSSLVNRKLFLRIYNVALIISPALNVCNDSMHPLPQRKLQLAEPARDDHDTDVVGSRTCALVLEFSPMPQVYHPIGCSMLGLLEGASLSPNAVAAVVAGLMSSARPVLCGQQSKKVSMSCLLVVLIVRDRLAQELRLALAMAQRLESRDDYGIPRRRHRYASRTRY